MTTLSGQPAAHPPHKGNGAARPSRDANPFLALPDAVGPRHTHAGTAAPEAHRPEPSALKRLHALLRGRYWVVAVLCLLGAVTGAVLGFRLPEPEYTSTGLVEVKLVLPSVTRDDRVMLLANQFMANQVALLQSDRVVDGAMTSPEWQATGRGNSPESRAEFLRALDVDIIPGSTYIRVRHTDTDPAVARAAVRSVVSFYRRIYPETNNRDRDRRLELLEQNRVARNREVVAKRDEILALSREFGTSNLDWLHTAKMQQVVTLEQELEQARATLDAHTAAASRATSATRPTTLPGDQAFGGGEVGGDMTPDEIATVDPTVRALLAQAREAEFQLKRLAGRMAPGSRAYLDAERDLRLVQDQSDQAIANFRARYVAIKVDPATGVPSPVSADTLRQLQDRVSALAARFDREKALTTSIGASRLAIQAANNEIDRLKGEVEVLSANIENLRAEANFASEVRVLSEGDLPGAPSRDKRKQMAAFGLAGGVALPFGLLLLVGLLDSRYRYSDDHSEALPHVKLLGILPDLPNLATDPQQATTAAHCVHQIRTMLEIGADTQGRRVIAVTSASPGDGKTSLSLALGLSFAAAGTRTLLIDCDVIGGGLSARMNQTHPAGTLEAVASRQLHPHVKPTDVEHLSILPVGTASQLHPTILSPTALSRLINEARAQFDIVLIDTGPVLGSVEASPVCASADAVVVVVSRGRHKTQVTKALDHLLSIGARLAGVVFNRASTPDFQRSTSRLTLTPPTNQDPLKA